MRKIGRSLRVGKAIEKELSSENLMSSISVIAIVENLLVLVTKH